MATEESAGGHRPKPSAQVWDQFCNMEREWPNLVARFGGNEQATLDRLLQIVRATFAGDRSSATDVHVFNAATAGKSVLPQKRTQRTITAPPPPATTVVISDDDEPEPTAAKKTGAEWGGRDRPRSEPKESLALPDAVPPPVKQAVCMDTQATQVLVSDSEDSRPPSVLKNDPEDEPPAKRARTQLLQHRDEAPQSVREDPGDSAPAEEPDPGGARKRKRAEAPRRHSPAAPTLLEMAADPGTWGQDALPASLRAARDFAQRVADARADLSTEDKEALVQTLAQRRAVLGETGPRLNGALGYLLEHVASLESTAAAPTLDPADFPPQVARIVSYREAEARFLLDDGSGRQCVNASSDETFCEAAVRGVRLQPYEPAGAAEYVVQPGAQGKCLLCQRRDHNRLYAASLMMRGGPPFGSQWGLLCNPPGEYQPSDLLPFGNALFAACVPFSPADYTVVVDGSGRRGFQQRLAPGRAQQSFF